MLAIDCKGLPTRGEQFDVRTVRKNLPHQGCDCVDQVLAIVEQQQQMPSAKSIHHALLDGLARPLPHAEHTRHCVADRVRIADRRKLHQPNAVSVVRRDLVGDVVCEPGFPDAADAGERH